MVTTSPIPIISQNQSDISRVDMSDDWPAFSPSYSLTRLWQVVAEPYDAMAHHHFLGDRQSPCTEDNHNHRIMEIQLDSLPTAITLNVYKTTLCQSTCFSDVGYCEDTSIRPRCPVYPRQKPMPKELYLKALRPHWIQHPGFWSERTLSGL
jgi:hypothetical protein